MRKPVLLAIFALFGVVLGEGAASPTFAAEPACPLPSGKLDYLDSRLFPRMMGPRPENIPQSRIQAAADCKSVRIWTAIAKSQKIEPPNEALCTDIHRQNAHRANREILECTDFPFYPSTRAAMGKPLPLAYLQDGALVTREAPRFGIGGYMGAGHHSQVILLPEKPGQDLIAMRDKPSIFGGLIGPSMEGMDSPPICTLGAPMGSMPEPAPMPLGTGSVSTPSI